MNYPNMLDAKRRTSVKPITYTYDEDKYKNTVKNQTFYIRTYGCQMNEHDSEKIEGMLISAGYKKVEDLEKATLIILNTCAIRENAHDKVFGFLGLIKHLKEKNKNIKIVICGCMAQEEKVVSEITKKYKYVDLVCGTHNIDKLIEYLNKDTKKPDVEVYSVEGDIYEEMPVKRQNEICAYVDIIYGCDKFCTYCVVPFTRGKQRSRSKEYILNEVKDLVDKGYKEVVLLGQNVNAYGKDLYDDYDLSNLLSDVSKTNIERIRFITSHPWDFTDKMIEVIANNKNILPYVHLPFQSASNKILKLMGRRYTKEDYIKLYNKIRTQIKNVSITTDIIVGFPGETEEDFNETLDLVKTCKFDLAYTFAYSKRENTASSLMTNEIDESVKLDRLHRLNEVINDIALSINKTYIGTTQDVLILGVSEKDNTKLMGYTPNMKLVNITGCKSLIGTICSTNITDAKSFSLDGIIK